MQENVDQIPIRAALYCRVSTYEQAQGNTSSLDGQESNLIEYCHSKNWSIYKIYRDTKSGKSLEREKIQELLNDAEDHKFDVVVATKLDRLSRSIRDFLDFDSRLNSLNVDVVITTQNIDTTTPPGKMQRNIMLVFAEFEREIIAERTREKLYYQATKGYWKGGHLPLGYDLKDKKLIVNQEEADIVRRIFGLYLDGKNTLEIANLLNQEGFRNKIRRHKGEQTSNDYNKDSILRILKNQIYLGVIPLKLTKIKGKVLTTPRIEVFKGLHDAIVDVKIFELAQKKLSQVRKNRHADYNDSPLLLLRKVVCGKCGAAMTTTFASKNGRKIYGYKCSTKTRKGINSCKSKDISANALESFILKLVHEIGCSEEFFDNVFAQLVKNDENDDQLRKKRISELQRNRTAIKAENERITNLLLADEELKVLPEFKSRLVKNNEKLKNIEAEIEKLEAEETEIAQSGISKAEIKQLLKDTPDLLKDISYKDQRNLIDKIINEIRWDHTNGEKDGKIEIFFRGDGHIQKKWIGNADPSSLVSSFYLDWLREQDSNLQPFG